MFDSSVGKNDLFKSRVHGQNEQNVCAYINATATQLNSVYQLNLSLNICEVG